MDTPEQSRDLCQKAGYTFTFLSDPKAVAIRRYDLVHAGAGENGQDIARPAEFLVDSTGTVRWVNLTENYWVRARPEQIRGVFGEPNRGRRRDGPVALEKALHSIGVSGSCVSHRSGHALTLVRGRYEGKG